MEMTTEAILRSIMTEKRDLSKYNRRELELGLEMEMRNLRHIDMDEFSVARAALSLVTRRLDDHPNFYSTIVDHIHAPLPSPTAEDAARKATTDVGKENDILMALSLLSPFEEMMAASALAPALGEEVGKFVRPKQLIRHLGGKYKWSSFLHDEVFPKVVDGPFSFLDLFGGSGIITFMVMASDFAPLVERAYYNELDSRIFNLIRATKEQPGKLVKAVQHLMKNYYMKDPHGRGFHAVVRISETATDPLVQSAAFLIAKKNSYWSLGKSPNRMHKPIDPSTTVPLWSQALSSVKLWNKTFEKALPEFIKAEQKAAYRVVFVDPPYIGSQGSDSYDEGMTEEQHQQLASMMLEQKCTYVFTHGVTPEYRRIYKLCIEAASDLWPVKVRYKERTDDDRNLEYLLVIPQR